MSRLWMRTARTGTSPQEPIFLYTTGNTQTKDSKLLDERDEEVMTRMRVRTVQTGCLALRRHKQ